MICPKCQTNLREREKEAGRTLVVIDICPNCGGIWLDKGELEKLNESERRYYDDDDDDEDRRYRDEDRDRYRDGDRDRPRDQRSRSDQEYRPKKKSSFLSSIFENMGGGED